MIAPPGWESSTPFKFIVNGIPVFIHRAILAEVSQPLHNSASSPFKEAQDGEAVLQGVDYETFARFVSWAYSRHYLPAAPTEKKPTAASPQGHAMKPEDEEELEEEKEEEEALQEEEAPLAVPTWTDFVSRDDDNWGVKEKSKRKKEKPIAQRVDPSAYLRKSFARMEFPEPQESDLTLRREGNDARAEDFTDLLLSHVKLYVFADEKNVEKLKQLVLYNLHTTLRCFETTPHSAREIVPMVSYVYENTHQSSDPMRQLVSKFIGSVADQMVVVKEFHGLLQNTDFAADFCAELDTYFNLSRVLDTSDC